MSSPPRMSLPSLAGEKEAFVASGEENQGPPQNARSPFMCFSAVKAKELLKQGISKKRILTITAEAWKKIDEQERAFWDEEARNDKVRYVREKAEYKGPWNIPKRRSKKDPRAPRRPMSAFLKYSKSRRPEVKRENPKMENTDVSRLLGEMWRNAPAEEKAPYIEDELRERKAYNERIQRFRDNKAKMDAASRTSHRSVASSRNSTARTCNNDVPLYKSHELTPSGDPDLHVIESLTSSITRGEMHPASPPRSIEGVFRPHLPPDPQAQGFFMARNEYSRSKDDHLGYKPDLSIPTYHNSSQPFGDATRLADHRYSHQFYGHRPTYHQQYYPPHDEHGQGPLDIAAHHPVSSFPTHGQQKRTTSKYFG